jgi:hypothetical protein
VRISVLLETERKVMLRESSETVNTLSSHPLMFTFRDAISGDGFLAGITLSGRALLTEEDGQWWMYGVRPGALAETGETPTETLLRFRNRYREILFDIAADCRDFERFKQEVERFFYEPDTEEERRWEDAAIDARSGHLKPLQGLALPMEAPELRPSQISLERLDGAGLIRPRFMPTDNVPDLYSVLAAA